MRYRDLKRGIEYRLIALHPNDQWNGTKPTPVGVEFICDNNFSLKFIDGVDRVLLDGFEAVEVIPEEEDLFGTEVHLLSAPLPLGGVGSSLPTGTQGQSIYTVAPKWVTLTGDVIPVSTTDKIMAECEALKAMLLDKNKKYGDSALSCGIAFNISPVTAIKARINDKLARLKNDNNDEDEDIIQDLLGYFILLRIANKDKK